MSRRIVVDASIAAAAGSGVHPTSTRCREFLLEMMTICHKIAMSPEVGQEWRDHASKYAISWLAAMRGKNKLVAINNGTSDSYLEQIQEITPEFTYQQVAAMEKDLLLIRAALAADRTVASCDNKVRELFSRSAAHVGDLRNVTWVNPDDPGEDCLEWLRSGAREESARRLGAGRAV